jgi:hypothetical protein
MSTRLKTLISIFLLAGLYALYYFVVPIALNIQSKTPQIINIVKKELGLDIKLSNPTLKMGLLPSIWVDASDFSIIEKDKSEPFVVKNPRIKIHLLPLLIGKVQLAYFSCDKMNLKLKFDKNSRFYLGNYLLIENANAVLSLEDIKMNVNSYKIDLNDELQSKNILLEGNYFELLKYKSKKHIKFSTDSKLKVNDRYSVINADIDVNLPFKKNFQSDKLFIDGTITNFDLSDISPYVRKFSKNKIKKLSGLVNIESKTQRLSTKTNRISSWLIINNLSVLGKDASSSIHYKDKLTVYTIFDVSRDALVFKKFQLLSNKINLNISGKISRITSKKPVLDLAVAIKDSRIEDFIALIPATTQNYNGINLIALKKYGYYSDLNGNISIKGKTDNPKFYGEILSTNGYITKPLQGKTPKATVKLNFSGQKIDLDILVPTSINDHLTIKGPVELFDEKNINLHIKSTPNVDLKTAQSILNPAHELFNFPLGPLPVLNLAGTANVDLIINGNQNSPHLNGAVNFRNMDASYQELAMKLVKTSGVLKFEDKDTHFYTKSGILNDAPIKIDGRCTFNGDLDYNIQADNQELAAIIDELNKSKILTGVKKLLLPIKATSGKLNFSINLKGKVSNINDIKFGNTVFIKGKIKLLGNDIMMNNLMFPIKNISGEIGFDGSEFALNLNSVFNHSKIFIKGAIKNNIANLNITSNLINIGEVIQYLPIADSKKTSNISSFLSAQTSINGSYKGPADKIDLNKIELSGKIVDRPAEGIDMILTSGDYEFKNSTLNLSKLYGNFKNNKFETALKIKNIFQKNQQVNGTFVSNDFDISSLKDLAKYPFFTGGFKKQLGQYSNTVGRVDLNVKAENNVYSSKIKLNDIGCVYDPMNLPIKIYSGVAEFKNNKLNLYKVNSAVDSMPLLIDGIVYDIFSKPKFNIYLNSKPTQKFIEKYINTNSLYPLKIKGDIIYSARIYGTKDNFNAKTEIKLEKDSNIYYMGSTLGDANDPIRILINADVVKNSINLINFRYQKLISSQNNKVFVSSQLSAQGLINVEGKNIKLSNFGIKTQNPTDAKIFNIIFKKPMIKQGQFTSDVVINGPISSPHLKGDLNFTGVNIPLLDTTIKDISLNFKDKTIDINSNGEIFSNKIVVSSVMENSLSQPYIFDTIDIYLEDLDINKIIKSLNNLEIEKDKHKLADQKQELSISDVIIKKARLRADSVSVKNIYATNFFSTLSLNEKLIFSVDKFQFDIAKGKVKGDLKYNLLNSNSNLEMAIDNVNANEMAYALFDLPDQIYGLLTGEVSLACNGKSHKSCMETLSGRGGFTVADGRMPKLGSLEYLLKATNLVKSGITGLSINGIVDLITPLKTGQLEMINGSFYIDSGIANSIQIFSKGKDLSLFINGTYNFSTLIADMNIFGRLSKKISTVLGPVGNASLNTLFNTIPGLNLDEENNAQFIKDLNKIPGFELNDKMYRIFNAKVYGDINGENYVQSFRWVE